MQALQISQLCKTYRNGPEALKGVDLDVEQGDFFALLGPNGAGKSTVIGIVSSLVNKTSGSVRVFGHDLDSEVEAVKACIGLVPQEFNFNQFEPVIEIVINQAGYYGIARREARALAEQSLRQLDLWDRRNTESRALSGGMKRRLMIARALVHRPRLLILDEPTAGVDIEIRRSMWAFLRETNSAGTTIILTTHYLEEAESLCRNIGIIDQGRVAQRSEMKALLRQLNHETFILDLSEDLADTPHVPGFEISRSGPQTLEVCVLRECGLNPLFNAFEQQGIRVLSMRNKENRLETLFMDLVRNGRVARSA